MDPLDRQADDNLLPVATRQQAAATAAAAGQQQHEQQRRQQQIIRVAVAQMTSIGSIDANFETVSRLAKVGCSSSVPMCQKRASAAAHRSVIGAVSRFPPCHTQEAVEQGCKMLFLPENVSFLGTSFTEARMLLGLQ